MLPKYNQCKGEVKAIMTITFLFTICLQLYAKHAIAIEVARRAVDSCRELAVRYEERIRKVVERVWE